MTKVKQQRDVYAEIDAITDVNQLRFIIKYFGESLTNELHSEDCDWPTTKEINRIMGYTLDSANKEWQDRLVQNKRNKQEMKEASTWYYCNCCGCAFHDIEHEPDSECDGIKCPKCGASYHGEEINRVIIYTLDSANKEGQDRVAMKEI